IAQLYSQQVSQSIRERLNDVTTIASDPTVLHAVTGGGTSSGHNAENSETAGLPSGVLNSNASQFLKQRRASEPQYLSIVVTNTNGQVVAASQPGVKPSYSQDAAWQAAYNNGQGATQISNVIDDEFTKSYYVNVNEPVRDPNSGATVGVVSAAVSISDVLTRFRETQVGNGATLELVNDDGTVISSRNVDVFSNVKSRGFDAVHDALLGLHSGQSGWVRAGLPNGPWIIGFAATTLKQRFPNLGWIVMVSQDERLAAAPVLGLIRFALIMVVLAGFMLTLLCVYYFLHRSQRFSHIEEEEGARPDRYRSATA
ncbi:MAG: cache domain-containing protein, partial [Acidobacteriaceae bacterium]|nr:cache domain-containing protein [Acidobacteriaceae bacterium]